MAQVKLLLCLLSKCSDIHPQRPRGYWSGRCDIFGRATFLARKFLSRAEEPLGTFSYQTSSRSVEIRSADWPEKYFSGQSTRRSSRVILSPFYTRWFSSSIEREDSREELKKKDLTKPRKSQTVTWELG